MRNSKILEGRLLSCHFPTSEGFSAPTMVLKQQSLDLKKPCGLRPQVPFSDQWGPQTRGHAHVWLWTKSKHQLIPKVVWGTDGSAEGRFKTRFKLIPRKTVNVLLFLAYLSLYQHPAWFTYFISNISLQNFSLKQNIHCIFSHTTQVLHLLASNWDFLNFWRWQISRIQEQNSPQSAQTHTENVSNNFRGYTSLEGSLDLILKKFVSLFLTLLDLSHTLSLYVSLGLSAYLYMSVFLTPSVFTNSMHA